VDERHSCETGLRNNCIPWGKAPPRGGGLAPNFSSPVRWRNALACLVKIADKFEAASNEVDNAHNVIMMWKHFGANERLAKVCHCLGFVQVVV
jgi:hypothetical protein